MRDEVRPAPEVVAEADRVVERERIRRGIRYCLGVFLTVRVALALLALLGVALLPHPGPAASEAAGIPPPVGVPGWAAPDFTAGWHNLFTAWERFDALWFLGIASEGYTEGTGSVVFFPLYPLMIRGLAPVLGGHPLAAGLLISNLFFLGSLVVLYFLTASEFDERVARRSVLYLAIFPTAFFFLAPYSESPFLFLALLSIWAARRGKWEVAGVAGALAGATRNIGLVLVPVLLVEAIHPMREGRVQNPARPLLWSVLAGAGTLAYLGWLQGFTGDALGALTEQARWQREVQLPWWTLWAGTREAFRWIGQFPGGYHLADWLLVVPALVAAVWVALRTRPLYGVYVWLALLAPLAYPFPLRPFLSMPRFLLILFPLAWAAAVWAERRRGVHEAVVGISGLGLGVLTLLFVNWYHVF